LNNPATKAIAPTTNIFPFELGDEHERDPVAVPVAVRVAICPFNGLNPEKVQTKLVVFETVTSEAVIAVWNNESVCETVGVFNPV